MAADIQLHWFQFNFLNEPSQRLKLSRPWEFENRKLDGYIGEATFQLQEQEISAKDTALPAPRNGGTSDIRSQFNTATPAY